MRGRLRLEHDRLGVSCEGVCPEGTLCGTVYAVLCELDTLEVRGAMFGESRQLSFRCRVLGRQQSRKDCRAHEAGWSAPRS